VNGGWGKGTVDGYRVAARGLGMRVGSGVGVACVRALFCFGCEAGGLAGSVGAGLAS
jgi:hypothetical protein